jgi:indole-3-acetate monooxygenase
MTDLQEPAQEASAGARFSPPEHYGLAAVARSLEPLIVEHEQRIETERTIPRELVDALWETGIFRAHMPREIGGLEMHPVEWLDTVEELSRINGSVGWLAMIQTGLTFMEPEVMREILAEGPFILAGNLGRAAGKAYRVDGGYRISGRWPFASGAPHATYLLGSSVLYDEHDQVVLHPKDGHPWSIIAVWPSSDAVLHDTWDGLGLRGTGSGDFEIDDLFVPSKHVNELGFSYRAYDRPLFRFMFAVMGHAAHALGLARAAIDSFIEISHGASTRGSKRQRRLGNQQFHHIAVAEADALVRAARLFAWDATERAFENAHHNEIVDYELRVLMSQAITFAVRSGKKAVDTVCEQAGTSSVFRGRPLERIYRDMTTAAQHALVSENAFDTVGQYYLTRDLPGGPQIDVEYSYIMPPHPHRLQGRPHHE